MIIKKPTAAKRCPIKLPVISEADVTTARIENLLRTHTPIYAWYTQPNIASFESFTGRNIDGLFMFRQELDFLCTYLAYFIDGVLVFKLYEVAMMTTESVETLIKERLDTATTVLYDDSGITEYQQSFCHDITDDMIREALKSRRSWIIEEKHFLKKP